MSNKKYYWLKLKDDFFEQDEIKIIEAMDNGKDYIIFYMKLLLKSVKTEGELRFKDTIPYSDKMLATITGVNVDIVRSATNVFIELGLIEKWENQTLYMNEVINMTGSETESAERVRRHRARKKEIENQSPEVKSLQCNANVIKGNTEIEIERELDKEIEIDNNTIAHSSKYSVEFERWWSIYPRKQGKGKAYANWKRDKLDHRVDELIEKLQQQVAMEYAFTEIGYIPHGSTYLNESRYDDDVIPKRVNNERSGNNNPKGESYKEFATELSNRVDKNRHLLEELPEDYVF